MTAIICIVVFSVVMSVLTHKAWDGTLGPR